jgi:hypothetical protein
MKKSTGSRGSRILVMMAMLGAMVMASPRPVRAQQDVDPTWYDPWAPATPVVAHVVAHANPPQATVHAKKEKAKTASSSQRTAKLHDKRSTQKAS